MVGVYSYQLTRKELYKLEATAPDIVLLAGGTAYTAGAIIYIFKKPNPFPGIMGFHEIFHLFIVAGALCHLFMVIQGVNIVMS